MLLLIGIKDQRIFNCDQIDEMLENFIDGTKLYQHFLVMTSALGRAFCFYDFAHLGMNSGNFSLLDRQLKESSLGYQEIDVSFLLTLEPTVGSSFPFYRSSHIITVFLRLILWVLFSSCFVCL